MKVAVLGTGMVGRAHAARLAELGHEVKVGTRDVDATMARTESDQMGNPPYSSWSVEHPDVTLTTFAEATADAEMIVNVTSGDASIAALTAAGSQNLAGKVLLDVANPLDFSGGFPPTLFVKDTDSLAEQIQSAFADVRVVKALNTMNGAVQVNPAVLANAHHSVFVSGNDSDAKKTVISLLESFGHTDIIDLGDLSTARGSEMILPLWVRLMSVLGTPIFNFKIVR